MDMPIAVDEVRRKGSSSGFRCETTSAGGPRGPSLRRIASERAGRSISQRILAHSPTLKIGPIVALRRDNMSPAEMTSTRLDSGIPRPSTATSCGRRDSTTTFRCVCPRHQGPMPGRSVRLFFLRASGPDFSERDRALLNLLRPHLQQAYHDAERRRSPVPDLTPRQWDLLHLIAGGRTNTQIARQLGLSEGTVRTHLENIYSRLQVSNRTAAVVRAFPGRRRLTSAFSTVIPVEVGPDRFCRVHTPSPSRCRLAPDRYSS